MPAASMEAECLTLSRTMKPSPAREERAEWSRAGSRHRQHSTDLFDFFFLTLRRFKAFHIKHSGSFRLVGQRPHLNVL